ncbi:MAG: SUMF1/EgtB/PvdO family nonheme iron enzyme [Prevotella sp.]|nr:SUMF1/EgtB/PvdO family nonheme iron enzyme [Prevotella sp.]
MVMVNGGTFMMGATDGWGYDNERPIHSVTLSSFMISKYEVTQQLWQIVMDENPSTVQGDNLPVNNISWDDCLAFIAKLNEKTGRTYRLATEAEWEFAARGGTAGKDLGEGNGYQYSGGYQNITSMDSYVWNSDNSDNTIHPVGTKSPNELGLYDMSGNVCEYVQDYHSSAYPEEAQHNPLGPESGDKRVYRGGSYTRPTWQCRLASRFGISPSNKGEECGLRLAMDAVTNASGDVDDDGFVTAADIVAILNVIEGNGDSALRLRADVNEDGTVNIADILKLIKMIDKPTETWYIVAYFADSSKKNYPMSTVGSLVAADNADDFTVLDANGYVTAENVIMVEFKNTTELGAATPTICNISVPRDMLGDVVSDHLTLIGVSGKVSVFNASGKEQLSTEARGGETVLRISHLPTGIYTVKCGNQTFKFMKK